MNPLLPAADLDLYCGTKCQSPRCDAHHDCSMLKFLRGQEVRERQAEIAEYVLTRHQAVSDAELVERFFLGGFRVGLDAKGRDYLARDFAGRLEILLGRDSRLRHFTLIDGGGAWGSTAVEAQSPGTAPLLETHTVPLDVAPLVDLIKAAQHPVALDNLLASAGHRPSPLDGHAASVALARDASVRCVFLDRQPGVGTYWVADEWVRGRLPSSVTLWPQPPSLFRPCLSLASLVEAPNASLNYDEQNDGGSEPGSTQTMLVTVDDVLCGSIVLDAQDHGLFPDQPNPLWLELHDLEHDGVHDCLMLTRGGRRELFGLGDLLLEGGGAGMRLRLCRTPAPHVVRVDWRAPARSGISTTPSGKDPEDRLARRVWRALLDTPQGIPLDELSALVGQPVERLRPVLAAFACFEPTGDSAATWQLSEDRPGLRRRYLTIMSGDDAETAEMTQSLVEEARALQVALRQLESDIDLIDDRLQTLEGCRR